MLIVQYYTWLCAQVLYNYIYPHLCGQRVQYRVHTQLLQENLYMISYLFR